MAHIVGVIRRYYRRDGDLEPGYPPPHKDERPGPAKTIAHTTLVPVR